MLKVSWLQLPEDSGQFCSSSSSPPDSVRELDEIPLRQRTSAFPRRLKEFVEENWIAAITVAVEYVFELLGNKKH